MLLDNKQVKEFLETVCREVRFKSIHENITEELEAHIEDQKNYYLKQGLDEETALLKSVKQMGDPVLIGKQLDKAHRPKMEWSILLITAVLVVIAGIVQYLMSGAGSYSSNNFLRFVLYVPLGIAAFSIMYFLDYTLFLRYSKIAYFAIITIIIISFPFSPIINGRYSSGYYFYLIITPILAGVIYNFGNKGYLGVIYSGLFCAGAVVPCILSGSGSSFLLLTISSLVILTVAIEKGFFAGNKKVSLLIAYIPTLLAIILQVVVLSVYSPYKLRRLMVYLNPDSDPSGIGFLPFMIKSLLSGARPYGSTILSDNLAGKSIEQLLPGWNTGLSYTYLVAKFGYIFGIALAAILIVLLLRMFMSVQKQKNAYGFILSFSACIVITAQILFYILSNLGVMSPITVTLPFISFGAASFILNMSLMGLLLSVHRRSNIVNDKLKINDSRKRFFTFEDGKLIIDLGIKS